MHLPILNRFGPVSNICSNNESSEPYFFFFERMMDEKLSPIHRIPFDHIGCSEMVEIVK
jgi:hypothetical protein